MANTRLFTLRTKEGSRRLLLLFIALILLFSIAARYVQSDGGRIKVEAITVDLRGAQLHGEMYYPADTSDSDKLPAVITTHGGSCQYGVSRGWAQELARRGFAVFNVNAYGNGYSEMPVNDASGQGKTGFSAMKTDMGLYDALQYVKTLDFVDPTRIGMVGHSMGAIRTYKSLVLDCGYLSLNDRLINALYDNFGQTFTAEEVAMNADELAAARLTPDQLAHYETLKAQISEEYNTTLKAAALIGMGSGACSIQPAEVTVGGQTVLRGPQTNIAFISGEYDGLYSFASSDANKAAMYTTEDLVEGMWYGKDDVAQTGVMYGHLLEDSILTNDALKATIEARSARLYNIIPNITHSKEFFDVPTTVSIVKYFEQTLGYNNGELADKPAGAVDASDVKWIWREVFNGCAMLSLFAMLLALAGMLIRTEPFAKCITPAYTGKAPAINKKRYWIVSALTVVLGFIAIHVANKNWSAHNIVNEVFLFSTASGAPMWYLLIISIGTILILGVVYFLNKKESGVLGIEKFYKGIKPAAALKGLVLGALLFFAAYVTLLVVDYFLGQDFRLWMSVFGIIKSDHWIRSIPYAVVMLPMYLIIGMGVNNTIRTDIPEWKDDLICVLVNSVGVWLCCLINILVAHATPNYTGSLFSSFIVSYGMLLNVPVTVYIARKMYRLTNNIWSGAMLNTLIILWSFATQFGINSSAAGYLGQGWLNVFLNM